MDNLGREDFVEIDGRPGSESELDREMVVDAVELGLVSTSGLVL
jgi:hypothetical protein